MKCLQIFVLVCLFFSLTLNGSSLSKTSPQISPRVQTPQQNSLQSTSGDQANAKVTTTKLSRSNSLGHAERTFSAGRVASPLSSSSSAIEKLTPQQMATMSQTLDVTTHADNNVEPQGVTAIITSIEDISDTSSAVVSASSNSQDEASPRPLERRPSRIKALLFGAKKSPLARRHSTDSSTSTNSQPVIYPEKTYTAPNTNLEPVELYQSGLSAYKQGRYADAYWYFLAAYSHDKSTEHRLLSARWLGEIVLRGWSVPADFTAALVYLKRAAKQDIDSALRDEALERLGEIYYYGLGVPQSTVIAIDYFKRVVGTDEELLNNGVRALPLSALPALFLLQKMSRIGGKGNKDKNETAKSLHEHTLKLCKHVTEIVPQRVPNCESESLAWLLLGRLSLDEGSKAADLDKAEEYFLKVAESEHGYLAAEACYRLGKLFYGQIDSAKKDSTPKKKSKEKKSKEKDIREKAIEFLERATQQELNRWVKPMAHIYLGHIYMKGTGKEKVPQVIEALEQYEKAVEQSYNIRAQAEAAYLCARLYEKGDKDFSADPAKAHLYDSTVAEQEYATEYRVHANYLLAMRYYQGTPTVPFNLQAAFKHFKRVAAESQDPKQLEEAWYRLAEMLSERKGGIKRNNKLATEYYQKVHTYGKNPAYIHKALCRLGEAALRKNDFKTATENLTIARELTHDPSAQRDAKASYMVLEEKRAKAVNSAGNNNDDDSDDEDDE